MDIEIILLGLLAFIGLSVLVSLIIYYQNYLNAKKEWKLECIAEMDIAENMKNNLRKLRTLVMVFLGIEAIIILFNIYNVLFMGAPYILLLNYNISIFIIIAVYWMILKKTRYIKLKICDKGIMPMNNIGYTKWDNYKGYYKKGNHLCLILSNGLTNIVQHLKYSEELENVIKTHLRDIKE